MKPMENRGRLDFAVGLFVVFAAVALVFIAMRAANITNISSADGYVIRAQFDHIGSLTERAPVKSAGVRVGRVKTIRFDNEQFIAEAQLIIEKQYVFPVDSIFSIISSNLLGGQYVSINAGGAEENLQPEAVVSGNSAIVLEHLISKFLFDKASE